MLCIRFEFVSFNTFEKQGVKERHGWAGLGQFTSKIDFRVKNKTFFIHYIFS